MIFTGKTNGRQLAALCGGVAALAVGVSGELRAAPPLDPLPTPDYSFDLSSPSVADGTVAAADILQVAYPNPTTLLPAATLELLSPLDDLDALSSGNPGILPTDEFALLFSVDRQSRGLAAPDEGMIAAGVPYNAFDQSARRHAAGDQYYSTDLFTEAGLAVGQIITANNVLSRNNFDEGGTNFSAYPSTHADTTLATETVQDAVDAFALLERRPSDGVVLSAYFSLTSSSPSLTSLSGAAGASGANIFVGTRGPAYDGACCYGPAGGACEIQSDIDCFANGGFWLGPMTTCEMCNAPPIGACCFGSGSCQLLDDFECALGGGVWLGSQTTCDMCGAPPADGACCLPDETCQIMGDMECFQGGGIWGGPGSPCDFCASLSDGACCVDGGQCDIVSLAACDQSGGAWLGPGTTCDLCDGPPTGACCQPMGVCDITSDVDCLINGGFWVGPGTTCADCDVPPPPGACCFGGGTCQIMGHAQCIDARGSWLGPDTTCDLCNLPPGACCYGDGTCQISGNTVCLDTGGFWLGPDTTCDLCPLAPGACCLPDGTCLDTDEVDCGNRGGLFAPHGTCVGDTNGNGTDDTCDALGDGLIVGLYASYADLGLQLDDNIDAMIVFDSDGSGVFDNADRVLFSLTPNSPSLALIPGASATGAAADVFVATPGQPAAVYASALSLGLGASPDNIDALGLYVPSATPLSEGMTSTDESGASAHGIRGGGAAIPAVSDWGMAVLTLLLMVAGTLALRPRTAFPGGTRPPLGRRD